ncbi:hypothetical protein J6590_012075 [Homalodisca vitripennis]|nr:hypothetical protein J6590_012075 [Homalodisca vitripennis]
MANFLFYTLIIFRINLKHIIHCVNFMLCYFLQVHLSPPSMNTVQSNVTGIKNFESLLQSYNLYSRSKQDITKKTTDNISANNTIAQATNSNKRFPTSKKDTFCTVSNNLDAKKMSTTKLSFKINNPMTSLKNKNKDRVERLVANIDNNQILNENQSNRLEPPKKVMIVEALPSKCVTTISADTNKSISNNFVKSNNVENESNSAKKKISNENALNMNNSIQLDCNLGSLYGIKKYISSLTADQNRTQELYQAQTTSQNVTSNVSPNKQLEITSVYNDQNISNKTQSPKPNSQQPNSKVTESYQLNIQLNQQTENDMFESETSENHSKNVTGDTELMSMWSELDKGCSPLSAAELVVYKYFLGNCDKHRACTRHFEDLL